MCSPKFPLGHTVITPAARHELPDADVQIALDRHQAGDWGELCKEDVAENELSLANGYRLLSAYTSFTGVKFWVITEGDRSVTTVLLPSDY